MSLCEPHILMLFFNNNNNNQRKPEKHAHTIKKHKCQCFGGRVQWAKEGTLVINRKWKWQHASDVFLVDFLCLGSWFEAINAHMVIDYSSKSQRAVADEIIIWCEQIETSTDHLYLPPELPCYSKYSMKEIWIFMDLQFIQMVCFSLH